MMPNQPRYPAYMYSASQWPQQLYSYGPQYWGYPQAPPYYGPYPGGTPAGNSQMQLGHPSPGRRKENRRRSSSPPPDVETHLLLGGRYRPTAVWDISLDPSTARQITQRGMLEPISSDSLESPATEPGASFMKIVCDLFPWGITIKLRRDEEVTVGMVMGAIFGALQEPLETEEWEEETNNNRRKMHRAMCARLARGPPDIQVEGRVKRIDSLGDKTEFLGLKPVGPGYAPEEWLLKLGTPRKKESRR